MATVTIVNLTDGSTHLKEIPSGYVFHLHWMDLETENQKENCLWFRAVLDSFVDEILNTEDFAHWRSKILTPVIVRAFYEANHFDTKDILTKMKKASQLGGPVTIRHWEGFYFNHDMLLPIHRETWQKLKQIDIKSLPGKAVEEVTTSSDRGEICVNTAMKAHAHSFCGYLSQIV
jgi:hypothetical protein